MPPLDPFSPGAGGVPDRESIPVRYTWNLRDICDDWDAWQKSFDELERAVEAAAPSAGDSL